MMYSCRSSWIGARCRVAHVILLACVRALAKLVLYGLMLAGWSAGVLTGHGATIRNWTGNASGFWSNPNNWDPVGAPQNGDYLYFYKDANRSMVNDLPDLRVRDLRFESHDYVLSGNPLTVGFESFGVLLSALEIGNLDPAFVTINCELILGDSAIFCSGSVHDTARLRLNANINLNGNLLVMDVRFAGRMEIAGPISGDGHVFVGLLDSTGAIEFLGSSENTFTGTLVLSRKDVAPTITFNKQGGRVVTNRLELRNGIVLSLPQPNQLGEDVTLVINQGSRLNLKGSDLTIGSLVMTNVQSDALPSLVDTTGPAFGSTGTLTLKRGLTSFVFNDSVVPAIRGILNLPLGEHRFEVTTPEAFTGFDLQAQIIGQGGFTKTGNAALLLQTDNTFSGPVVVNAGTVEARHNRAFGAGANGVQLNGGNVNLRNVAVATEPLTVTASGSLLQAFGPCSWAGSIALNQSLIVFGQDFNVSGVITGTGDLALLGTFVEFSGSSPNTFTGTTRVGCERLTLNKAGTGTAFAFSGPLLIGPERFAPTEVRWLNDSQINRTATPVTLGPMALMNLNGHNDTIGSLVFNGGTVQNAGAGTLSLFQTITANVATATANISGGRLAIAAGVRTFHVDDGPPEPDLAIRAIILDFGAITKTGLGTLRLSGANTFLGSVNVNAGMIHIQSDLALGSTAGRTTVANGATLQIERVAALNESLTIAGAGVGGTRGALLTSADVFVNSDLVLSGAAAIRTEGTNSRLQVNNISGTGPLTKLGSGRLVLRGGGHNTYTGDTLVTEGVLVPAKDNTLASVPGHLIIGTTPVGVAAPSARVEHAAGLNIVGSVTVNAGGLWDLNGQWERWEPGDLLPGRPPLTLNGGGDVQTGAGILFLPPDGGIVVNPGAQRLASSTIAGRINLGGGTHRITVGQGSLAVLGNPECNLTAAISESGSGAELEKAGPGTLRLAGTNFYRGATRIIGGTLQVDGVQPQSVTRVFDGGRLKGLGIVGSIEMLGANAIVAPGIPSSILVSGTGILTCSNFNMGAVNDGILFVELNGTTPGTGHDQINARGTVRLTGLSLQGSVGFASSINQQFIIINNDGADPVQGTFDGLAQDASLFLGGERFTISYTGGTGNDVVLTRQVTPQLTLTTLPATEVPNFALDFDGRFNRVHVGTNLFPNITNNFTIELWANPTASRLETREADLGISDIANQRHAIFPDHGDFGYGANHAGAGLSIGTNGISVFEHASNHLPSPLVYSNAVPGWTHVALVYSNRLPRLYVNGALARVGMLSEKTFVHPSANLGGSIQGLAYGNFRGQLDEVRIWNRVLSQAQIQTNFNRSLTGTEPGLVLYFRCEETNGVSLVDSAPASPNPSGTLLNGVASVLSGSLPPAALNGPTVTLNGLATPGGLDASMWFEWGATTNYGNLTAAQSVSAVTRAAGYSQILAGLAAGQYHFRAVGSNGLHFSFGQNQSFTLLNGAPRLRIEKLSGNQVRLLWPTSAVGFTLQANPDPNTANWSATGLPISVVGANNTALDSITSGKKFYRLFKP